MRGAHMKKPKQKESPGRNVRGLAGIAINVLLISALIVLAMSFKYDDSGATAGTVPAEELDPSQYQYLTYNDNESALEEINDQLSTMSYGNIQTVDDNSEIYTARLMRDYEMGDIIYWEISDEVITVAMDADTGEIIYYHNGDHKSGDFTESQAAAIAFEMANQFYTLPSDKSSPNTRTTTPITWVKRNSSTNETTIINETYYITQYKRLKNTIVTEDTIVVTLDTEGNLCGYSKIWWMDLSSFSTTYTIAQNDAEQTALTHAGAGSEVNATFKKIVRPNKSWTEDDVYYGEDPTLVWSIYVKDADDNLRIYHVDGVLGTIVGGDSGVGWFG
jgi:hypothetical protein